MDEILEEIKRMTKAKGETLEEVLTYLFIQEAEEYLFLNGTGKEDKLGVING